MIYQNSQFLLIAGPCSLESRDVVLAVAEALAGLNARHPEVQVVFKGSFDKANRTSLDSPRGSGLDLGLEWFSEVKRRYGFPTLTDVHLPDQCSEVAKVCDVLQIPAFLCRQTDLLQAAAETGAGINVKKGQFLSPADMRHVVNKLHAFGAEEIWQTERGTTFGYQNLVVDMRSFPIMNEWGPPTIMDATHSVQMPGGSDGISGGKREFVPVLARAGIAAGAQGLFVETHPEPAHAISDAASQWPLDQLTALIEPCLAIWEAIKPACHESPD